MHIYRISSKCSDRGAFKIKKWCCTFNPLVSALLKMLNKKGYKQKSKTVGIRWKHAEYHLNFIKYKNRQKKYPITLKTSKLFFLKSDARFRFLVKNYVRYYIFFFQNFVFKLKKCKKPPKLKVFQKQGLFKRFLHFFQLKHKI